MSAHVLLNLLNKLGKRDKMRGLPSIISLFRNEFNEFNNTRARMLDSIYHMKNTLKSHFWRKNVIIMSLCTQRCYGRQVWNCLNYSIIRGQFCWAVRSGSLNYYSRGNLSFYHYKVYYRRADADCNVCVIVYSFYDT